MAIDFYPGQHVHIDTQNPEWGRVATNAVVITVGDDYCLVDAYTIRANIAVPFADIVERIEKVV